MRRRRFSGVGIGDLSLTDISINKPEPRQIMLISWGDDKMCWSKDWELTLLDAFAILTHKLVMGLYGGCYYVPREQVAQRTSLELT